MSYLGLDIGTGGCKAVVFSGEGKEIASSFREYPVLHPRPDCAELDPDEVINKCFEVIREVNSRIDDPVLSMSISSQGEAFTPVGPNGEVLGNAMVSSDARARDITLAWSAEFGIDRLYRITGHTPHPLFTLFKILWIRKNQPDTWSKTRYFFCFEDLLHYRVGIRPYMSWPLAGRTMLFDVVKHKWSDEILNAAGFDHDKLAEPLPSGEIAGTIDLKTGKPLGFKNPVTVVTGGHDQTCAALGAGVIDPGMCMYATGTVECFCPMIEAPRFSRELKENNLCCYDFTITGKYTSVAYSLTGGNILRWMRDELGRQEIEKAKAEGKNPYTLLLDAMPGKPTSLLVLPYFSATGTPYFDTRAKGAIVGLQHSTSKAEITRALLEGVALEMKLNLQIMENSGMHVGTFIATGGGTRHKAWNQLKADVLGKKIVVKEIAEAGCFGAAMLARSVTERIPVEEIFRKLTLATSIISPDPDNARIYDEKFGSYKQLYPALKIFWEE